MLRSTRSMPVVCALALLVQGGCATRSYDIVSTERIDKTFTEEKRVHVDGAREMEGGTIRIQVTPTRDCVEATPVTVTERSKKLNKSVFAGWILGLTGLTYYSATTRVTPAAERTIPSDCQTYMKGSRAFESVCEPVKGEQEERLKRNMYLGLSVTLDVGALFMFKSAIREASKAPERSVRQGQTVVTCTMSCNYVGKRAYVMVALDKRDWCLEIGRIRPDNSLEVPSSFWRETARRLPESARREFQYLHREAIFDDPTRLVIPECGDRHDCQFWRELQ